MKFLSFGVVAVGTLGSLATIVQKVQGIDFQLKLRWKKKSVWPKANLCAACSTSNCANGRIVLKACNKNDIKQIWTKSGDKIQPKLNGSRCLSFKNWKNVKITQCQTNANTYQKVTEIASEKKIKIKGKGRCLSVRTNTVPETGVRLEMRTCENALNNDVVYWLRLAITTGPTTNAPIPTPTNIPSVAPITTVPGPSPTPVPVITKAPITSPPSPTPIAFPVVTEAPVISPLSLSPLAVPVITEAPITSPPSPSPTSAPIPDPSASSSPTKNTVQGPTDFPFSVVIDSRNKLEKSFFVFSPNKKYKVGLTSDGDLELQDDSSRTIWNAGARNGSRCYMQPDGNVVIRSSVQGSKALWSSETYNNPGAQLVVDDGGRIAVLGTNGWCWFDGIPRGEYNCPSSNDLDFPVRGIFYYPWYPETWTVKGKDAHFKSDLGLYSSSDPRVAESHIDSFDYAGVDLSIASWFGADTNLDRARLTMLMDETVLQQSPVKWTVYHEDERSERPSANKIRVDLDYLMKWFAWHPAWAHADGRPVIFVYNSQGCDVVTRWMNASNGDWYVVLKLFPDFKECPRQPDGWHQYGIGKGTLQYPGYSFTIGSGFWHATEPTPRLERLSKNVWCSNVELMAASGDPWQLIVSFNEAGEGTMIEASSSWKSNTKYGYYLDCLNEYPTKYA